MNKLKGSLGAIKMKYLIFVFAAAMLVALPTRVYQLLALVDPANGYYNSSDITIPVLYGAVFLFACIFMVLSFLSKEVPSPKLPTGKNPILGVTSIVMVLGLGWDILSIERKIVPQVQGDVNMEIFKSLLSSNLEQSGGLFTVLRFIFAMFAIFYFVIFAVSHLNGKASYKEYKLLALSPLCWAITGLISKLMTAVSFLNSSELLFEIFMLVFAMLFLLTFARISTGVFTEDSMWGIFGYGFAASLFAGLVTIPRLVCAAVGVTPVDEHEFSFVYLAMMIFILSYIVASLGIGFKDGLKNIKTISEVELPSDDEVVVKHATPVVEPVSVITDSYDYDEEEYEEESVEAPAEEEIPQVEESVEAPAMVEEADEEAVEEVAEEAFEEAPVEATEEVAPEIAEETAEEVVEEAITEAEEPTEVVEEAVEEPIEASVEEVEEPTEADVEAPVEEIPTAEEAEESPVDAPAEGEETIEETLAMFDESEVVEPKTEAPAKKKDSKPKAKKEKKSLFGLRKAPAVEDKPVDDDIKPISLADLRKKNDDQE